MLKKAYIEITNVCNLSCAFCHGTRRAPRLLPPEDFRLFAEKLRPLTPYFYLHVLGEPLTHPALDAILSVCDGLAAKVTLVTNGMLIEKAGVLLLTHPCLYKTAFSLHAFDPNFPHGDPEGYLSPILAFARAAAPGVIVVYKFWNGGAPGKSDPYFYRRLRETYGDFTPARNGYRLAENVFLDAADRFSWPDLTADETPPAFCIALRDQLAVLSDGTVVPCCLDADGAIPLGNLYTDDPAEILRSPRARAIVDGFSAGRPTEDLCRRCGFAAMKFGTEMI